MISKEQLDSVYRERNMCVALIAALAKQLGMNCGIKHHEDKPGEEWEDEWRNVFFLDLPTGQVSWHLHISEMENFPTLRPYTPDYDNHSTEEKYRRVVAFASQAQASEPTGDYQIRDHVSYAVGDPYGMFDHIPHVILPNGAVLMSQDAIEEAWRRSHDFEPLEGWRASRYSESEGAQ